MQEISSKELAEYWDLIDRNEAELSAGTLIYHQQIQTDRRRREAFFQYDGYWTELENRGEPDPDALPPLPTYLGATTLTLRFCFCPLFEIL